MSVIKVTLPYGEIPVTGKQVSFVAPCNCIETTGLQIDGELYTVVDTFCECVNGNARRWEAGAIVSVILDVEKKQAFLGGGSSSRAVVVTLAADGWIAQGDGRCSQTVAVSGVTMLDSQVIVVDVYVDGVDLDADATVIDAWGPADGSGPSSQNITQGDGNLTFYCVTAPTVNIPVVVGVH